MDSERRSGCGKQVLNSFRHFVAFQGMEICFNVSLCVFTSFERSVREKGTQSLLHFACTLTHNTPALFFSLLVAVLTSLGRNFRIAGIIRNVSDRKMCIRRNRHIRRNWHQKDSASEGICIRRNLHQKESASEGIGIRRNVNAGRVRARVGCVRG